MPTYALNKKARFNYTFQESWEAGLVLTGAEVKAIRANKISLAGAYVSYENGQLWLKNCQIFAYQEKNQPGHEPTRPKRLLLKRQEIDSLMGKIKAEGLTIIPEKVYSKGGLIKVLIWLARGKKAHDKRAAIKKRDVARKISRALKSK